MSNLRQPGENLRTTVAAVPLQWDAFHAGLLRFAGLFLVAWVSFYAVYWRFPYVRNGADIIYEAKQNFVGGHRVFGDGDKYRVVVVGNSRTLAGFQPAEFDRAVGRPVASYNLGLPAEDNFLPILQRFLDAGNRPTHVLIQSPWPNLEAPTILSALRDSRAINQFLFPFHKLPRDLALFSFDAITRKGFAQQYAYNSIQVAHMLRDRGWYFIEGQSHSADHRLPADYKLPSDTPDRQYVKPLHWRSYIVSRLLDLSRSQHFDVWLVPSPFRNTEFAPPPNGERGTNFNFNEVKLVGPDYVLYPPAQFSDPIHLNPSGAAEYSRYLATLFRQRIEAH